MTTKKLIAYGFIGVIVLSIVAAFFFGGTGSSDGIDFSSGETIVVLYLTGPIQDSGSGSFLSGGGITPRSVRRQLREAERSGRVAAVVLRMNTGGGTVAASQEIARMVDEFDSDKPIVVSMGDTVASGGYYIASQADHIVAQPGTLTGSIGVIWTTFDYAGLLDKVGIELDTITAGKHKDMFLPGRMTPERRQIVQDLVDDSYEQFIAAVVDGRGLTDAVVRSLATGQVYTGAQALKFRLVDELGARAISDGGSRRLQAYETDEVALSRIERTRGCHSGIQPLVKNGKLKALGLEVRLAPSAVAACSRVAASSFLGRVRSRTAIFRRLNAAHTRFHSLRTFCRPR